jgi:glycosyltransferase involved in cell wall biosynthesis
VLILHNRYQFAGGEDAVVRQESEMLTAAGIAVEVFITDNDGIVSASSQLRAARDAFYSRNSYRLAAQRIAAFRPDVVHVHNFLPRLSPSVYDAALDSHCAVVQSLHNYRLLCVNAQLFRNGSPCEKCVGRTLAFPGVLHKCYRGSGGASAVVAGMTAAHRVRGTWRNRVHRYIAVSEFARELFIRSKTVPADRIVVKPNPVADPGIGRGDGNHFLFAGRLSPEKGIRVLLQAAALQGGLGLPLKIAGDGPLKSEVLAAAATQPNIEYLGSCDRTTIAGLMQRATALIFPSICYETFGLTIAEAFAAGTPAIASNLGVAAETVIERENGLLFEAGNPKALQSAAAALLASPGLIAHLRRGARSTYEQRYTTDKNLAALLDVYDQALHAAGVQLAADPQLVATRSAH